MKRAALLAVDAGGSKTDAVLATRRGEILGLARARPSELMSTERPTPSEGHLDAVAVAVSRAADDAGLDPDRLPVAEIGVFSLAGFDFPQDGRRLQHWLRSNGWASEEVVQNDTYAVLRAGTDRTWGVAIVCGQGTNCTGVAPDGRTFRLPAIGTISGDWGGGGDIGGAALWNAVRAVDGRGAKTSLAKLVPAHFGFTRPRQVTEAIYFRRLRRNRLNELAPVVFSAADEGDAVARSIVDRQADEVVTMARAAIRKLRMAEIDVDVVLGGGIFRNRSKEFFRRIEDGLHALAPSSRMIVLSAPPVAGAALVALDGLGAGPAAKERLRAALTGSRLAAHTRPRRPRKER
ncbi:MAG: ATPase [Actinomycetota bacterium]|nr:ATPase [Actinomycetota bacterium]